MEPLTSVGSIIFYIWEQALQWKFVFRLSSEMWYKRGADWTLSYSLWSQWNDVHFLWPPVRVRKICFRKWTQLWEESSTWNHPQSPPGSQLDQVLRLPDFKLQEEESLGGNHWALHIQDGFPVYSVAINASHAKCWSFPWRQEARKTWCSKHIIINMGKYYFNSRGAWKFLHWGGGVWGFLSLSPGPCSLWGSWLPKPKADGALGFAATVPLSRWTSGWMYGRCLS